ncbi:hypothetical protein HanRHA438_Chr01g0010021 [Helianthus annuus]|nr:hypothetical protein HanRHA438_Chr01g0010021 [Helianthus annuus]
MPAPEISTTDTESDPDMLTKDEDNFQPSALPDFGDELPLLMVSLTKVFLSFFIQSTTALPFGHFGGEHLLTPNLDNAPPVDIPSEGWLLNK